MGRDWVFLSNRARYALGSVLEALQTPRWAKLGRTTRWDYDQLPAREAFEHPSQPGLFLIRGVVGPSCVTAVREMAAQVLEWPLQARTSGVHARLAAAEAELQRLQARHLEVARALVDIHLAEQLRALHDEIAALRVRSLEEPAPPPPVRTAERWEWFEYDPGRLMAPMHAHRSSGLPTQMRAPLLHSFEVFDSAAPSDWLQLDHLCTSSDPSIRNGAYVLRALQDELPVLVADARRTESPSEVRPSLPMSGSSWCVFHQLQFVQRGAQISSHIDAPSPPADVVATLSLGEGMRDTVRVGDVVIPLQPGDLYLISGSARWDVDHEVHASTSDRLSITLRYWGGGSCGPGAQVDLAPRDT